MWQLLGFGEVDTPDRRYAIVDENGKTRWAGQTVREAMTYVLDHDLQSRMERDSNGDGFVRERAPTRGTRIANLPTGRGPWGGAGE